MLERLGRTAHDHRGRVLFAWIAALLLIGGWSGAQGSAFSSEFGLPDVESERGFQVLDERFGGFGSGQSGPVAFFAEQGVEDPEVVEAMSDYFAELAAIDELSIESPYEVTDDVGGSLTFGPGQVSVQGEFAGQIAFAEARIPRDTSLEEAVELGEEMRELAPDLDGLTVYVGGQTFAGFEEPQSEILGLAFAIVILIVSFGSVLAMGLPIGTAIFGIGIGTSLVILLSQVMTMPDFTLTIGLMIGLGVGIDYALFIVTRFREELALGRHGADAAGTAIDTAGRAVLFAGMTVMISLLGMLLMGVEFVNGLGIGAAITVGVTMLASVTLLPALMGFAGDRLEVTRWRGLIAAGLIALGLVGAGLGAPITTLIAAAAAVVVLVAGTFLGPLRAVVPTPTPKPRDQTFFYRWSRFVQRYPWPTLLVGGAVLVVMALPVLGMRFGFSDEGNFSTDTDARQAYDLLADGFGPGHNGPLLIVAELDGEVDGVVEAIDAGLAGTEGVAFASPGQVNSPDAPTAAIWQVIPTTSPQDEATVDLVNTLRDEVLPAAVAGTDVTTAVTGQVAISVDFSEYLAARMPIFFGVVLLLSFLLLMAVFRSILVPLKAVIMNLISIGAAYGLAVAVFQWGWGGDLLGIEPAPIEPFLPMMLFAIVFGLSMDYEVFLLSRVKEEYDKDRDNGRAVADGLAATARVITAAAAIMVFVFGSFLLEDDRVIKLFGFGLASAIALDATIVRMLLVPATMALLGDRNWWLPAWLDRLLPTIDVEGGHHEGGSSGDADGGPDDDRDPTPERPREPAGV